MKKSFILVSLVAVFVLGFAASAMAYSLGNQLAPNENYYGYASWTAAVNAEATNGTSPHGNYTTSTNKCAVCHSVHKAAATGKVLTAWTGYVKANTTMDPYQSCMWCHGTSSPLFAVSTIGNAATLSPHGYCGRCHTASVHGAGGSAYPALKAKMLNTGGDADIAVDLAAINTNVAIDMTTNTGAGAVAVGTGYICGACHSSSSLALPVTALGQVPAKGGVAAGSVVTGHKIIAAVSTTWNEDGSKGAYYSGMVSGVAGDSQVVFNAATGCKSCHDARFGDQTTGALAFPHNYVNSVGGVAAKTDLGSSYVWLTTGADSAAAHVVAGKTQAGSADSVGTEDGLCLKCHRSGNGISGVGQTF